MTALTTAFEVIDGRLEVLLFIQRGRSYPIPSKGYKRIYLIGKTYLVEVDNLGVLEGQVRILSPEAALAYVRLPSTASTFFLFPKPLRREIDIIDRDTLNLNVVYGDRVELQSLQQSSNGFCGILDHRLYQSLHLPPTLGETESRGYRIQRLLYVEHLDRDGQVADRKVVLVRQFVGHNGHVTNLSEQKMPEAMVNAVRWVIPRFK